MKGDTTREADKRSKSDREREHATMLEEALARPGVREAMQVFGGWQEKDRSLDAYRAATRAPTHTTTTDRSNAIRSDKYGEPSRRRKAILRAQG